MSDEDPKQPRKIDREDEVRKRIVEFLAFETGVAQKLAWAGGFVPGLGERVGVLDSTLQEAISLARAGQGPMDVQKSVGVAMDLNIDENVRDKLAQFAERMNLKLTTFIRSFFHAAMQTSKEPTIRILRYKDGKNLVPKVGVHFTLSRGLLGAISRRATALGLSRRHYMTQWLTDVCEMKCKDMEVVAVSPKQLFNDAHSYVVPDLTWVLRKSQRKDVDDQYVEWLQRQMLESESEVRHAREPRPLPVKKTRRPIRTTQVQYMRKVTRST